MRLPKSKSKEKIQTLCVVRQLHKKIQTNIKKENTDQHTSGRLLTCLYMMIKLVILREQMNFGTAYLDGSGIYGATPESADKLREFDGGFLKVGNTLARHLM